MLVVPLVRITEHLFLFGPIMVLVVVKHRVMNPELPPSLRLIYDPILQPPIHQPGVHKILKIRILLTQRLLF